MFPPFSESTMTYRLSRGYFLLAAALFILTVIFASLLHDSYTTACSQSTWADRKTGQLMMRRVTNWSECQAEIDQLYSKNIVGLDGRYIPIAEQAEDELKIIRRKTYVYATAFSLCSIGFVIVLGRGFAKRNVASSESSPRDQS